MGNFWLPPAAQGNPMMPMGVQPSSSTPMPLQNSTPQASPLTGVFGSPAATPNTGASTGFTGFNNNNLTGSNLAVFTMINMMMMQVMTLVMGAMQLIMSAMNKPPSSPATGVPPGGDTSSPPGGQTTDGSTPPVGNVTGSAAQGNPTAMQKLAAAGKTAAQRRGTRGMCAAGVGDALDAAGYETARVPSAYQKADVLARNSDFKEIKVSRDELKNLPAGCIIVWNKTPGTSAGNIHGHIAITQGNGRETSDHEASLSMLGGSFRVFVPVKAP